MLKTVGLMLVAVTLATLGDIFMSKAMKSIGEVQITDLYSLWTTGVKIFTSLKVWLAIGCMAGHFFVWISVLSWADLSYVLPMGALTYVLNAFLSPHLLGEQVPTQRWLGVILITAGVMLVVLSEAKKATS